MERKRWARSPRWLVRMPVAAIAAIAVILSSSTARATTGGVTTGVDPPIKALSSPAQYLVLMVLDGARPDYFHLTRLPHLDALMAGGTQFTNAFAGILESETPSAHTTISTGTTPRRNGILGFAWAINDSRYSLFNPDVVRAGAMEHIMQSAGVPTIAGLYKTRYPHARVVALSGHKYYAADPLGGPAADAIMYYRDDSTKHYAPTAIPGHVPPYGVLEKPWLSVPSGSHELSVGNALATQLLLSAFDVMRPRIILINYPDFDWPLGHVDGGIKDRPKVISMMQTYDRDLGLIEDAYRRAGILNKTLFVVTADHGMSPIKRFIPEQLFYDAVAKAGTSSPAQAFSTGAYLWLKDTGRAKAVATNIIRAHNPGISSVYYWSTSGSQPGYVRAPGTPVSSLDDGANRFLLYTLVNGHQPQVVAFCKRNATTVKPDTYWKADHGGASWPSQHIPLVLNGPGVARGRVVQSPAQLIDIAPTVLADMGVRPDGMDGYVLTDALTQPAAADKPVRAAEITRVWPVAQGLQAEDKAERGR